MDNKELVELLDKTALITNSRWKEIEKAFKRLANIPCYSELVKNIKPIHMPTSKIY